MPGAKLLRDLLELARDDATVVVRIPADVCTVGEGARVFGFDAWTLERLYDPGGGTRVCIVLELTPSLPFTLSRRNL